MSILYVFKCLRIRFSVIYVCVLLHVDACAFHLSILMVIQVFGKS